MPDVLQPDAQCDLLAVDATMFATIACRCGQGAPFMVQLGIPGTCPACRRRFRIAACRLVLPPPRDGSSNLAVNIEVVPAAGSPKLVAP